MTPTRPLLPVRGFLSIRRVAELLQLPPSTVRALIRRGDLGAHRLGARLVVHDDDLDAFKRRIVTSPPTPSRRRHRG